MDDGFVRCARFPLGGDRVFADRFAGRREPLLPFLGALGFVVGEQQQRTTDPTATALRLQEAQADAVERWIASLSPPGPVFGQGGVVRGRLAWHHLVSDDAGPGVFEQVVTAVAVAEDPLVTPGLVVMPISA